MYNALHVHPRRRLSLSEAEHWNSLDKRSEVSFAEHKHQIKVVGFRYSRGCGRGLRYEYPARLLCDLRGFRRRLCGDLSRKVRNRNKFSVAAKRTLGPRQRQWT